MKINVITFVSRFDPKGYLFAFAQLFLRIVMQIRVTFREKSELNTKIDLQNEI